jgi:hypothetical protein
MRFHGQRRVRLPFAGFALEPEAETRWTERFAAAALRPVFEGALPRAEEVPLFDLAEEEEREEEVLSGLMTLEERVLDGGRADADPPLPRAAEEPPWSCPPGRRALSGLMTLERAVTDERPPFAPPPDPFEFEEPLFERAGGAEPAEPFSPRDPEALGRSASSSSASAAAAARAAAAALFNCARRPFSSVAIAEPSSAGDFTVFTPAASSARYLSAAVPLPPATIAPACPIRLPGGAVTPAMYATTGLVT